MRAEHIVDQLLEAEEAFDARAFLEKTPDEEFNEGAEWILKRARGLYAHLKRNGVLDVVSPPEQGIRCGLEDMVLAILQLTTEKDSGPGVRRAYLRLKKYGRFLI